MSAGNSGEDEEWYEVSRLHGTFSSALSISCTMVHLGDGVSAAGFLVPSIASSPLAQSGRATVE
jgi:hypothetical protein